jgi:hypothetical protein
MKPYTTQRPQRQALLHLKSLSEYTHMHTHLLDLQAAELEEHTHTYTHTRLPACVRAGNQISLPTLRFEEGTGAGSDSARTEGPALAGMPHKQPYTHR